MKTPDEIKKGLQYCFMEEHSTCSGCPYDDSEDHELKCLDEIQKDAFAYIQQLEEKLKAYEWYEGERNI